MDIKTSGTNRQDINDDMESEVVLMPVNADTRQDIININDIQKHQSHKTDKKRMKSLGLW